MQPGNYDDFLSHNDVLQSFHKTGTDFEPGIGCSLGTLPRRVVATFYFGTNEPNWVNQGALSSLIGMGQLE